MQGYQGRHWGFTVEVDLTLTSETEDWGAGEGVKQKNICFKFKFEIDGLRNKMQSFFFLFCFILGRCVLFCLVFGDRVSLCSLGCSPATHSVDQPGLELTEMPLPLPPRVLGLKTCTTTSRQKKKSRKLQRGLTRLHVETGAGCEQLPSRMLSVC